MKTLAAQLVLALFAVATSAVGAPPTKEQYVKAALANLNATSRTAGGTVDTSASKDKAASMAEVSGEQAAQLANKNFEAAIGKLYDSRKQAFPTPEKLRAFVEAVATDINTGIVKPGVLLRVHDSDKYPYTRVKNLERSLQSFYAGLHRRLDDPKQDPVQLAAWVEYHIDLTDHFFADGCGKISKAISAYVLMRRGRPLPVYPTDRKALFAAAPTKAIDLEMKNDAPQFAKWLKFYKSLFK